MNDKTILPQNEKNYVETLYLYINLENASTADLKTEHSTLRYFNVVSYMSDNMFPNAICLGESKGRTWYQFPNYRLGIMDYDKAKIVKQYNCLIQYEQHHLFTLDKNLNGLDLPFDISREHYKIKRIDITKIAKLDIDYTDNYGYISPYRGMTNDRGTIYLGHRKNGNVFRIYNKTKELLETANFKKIELLSKYFGSIENLYTFELELSRSVLNGSLGIDNLSQLKKVYAANKNIVSKIRFYKNHDKNKKLVKDGHSERVPCRVLTDFIEFERIEKKHYKPSFDYAVEQIVKIADIYAEKMDIKKSNDIYMKIANAFLSRRVSQKNKDLVISFEDTHLSNVMDEMTTKHHLMRDNQSNELELEADRAFKEVEISHINSPMQDTICHQEEVRQKEASPLSLFSERV